MTTKKYYSTKEKIERVDVQEWDSGYNSVVDENGYDFFLTKKQIDEQIFDTEEEAIEKRKSIIYEEIEKLQDEIDYWHNEIEKL